MALRFDAGEKNIAEAIASARPTLIFNLWRGEAEAAYQAHLAAAREAERQGALYGYFSSASAVLGHPGGPHLESERALGVSDYGKFKMRCENALLDIGTRSTIYRFACAHGVAENRRSRTEAFLAELTAGQCVEENANYVENRLLDTELAKAVIELAVSGVDGVIHLGALCFTDEVTFKRKLARAFGYDAELVRPTQGPPIHAGLWPERALEVLGAGWFSNDEGIVSRLASHPALARYLAAPKEVRAR
jgi:dTDP-4-dehydrorhamnose reductase